MVENRHVLSANEYFLMVRSDSIWRITKPTGRIDFRPDSKRYVDT